MLNVSNLCINYGNHRVVDGVDFTLGDDEILMLVGPTGCGKTTILQALAGLIPVSDGSISVGNWTASATKMVPPEKRNVGMMFQDFALFPHLTVLENVSFRQKDIGLAKHWLELLGLSQFCDVKPTQLSGGQKQRVALARTLAHQPSYVLLDEPLSNLDAALKDTLRWDIRQALKEAAVPAIWVTHDQHEALSIGDRVGILKAGKVQQMASPEECFSQPANRFIAGFLGEAAFLPATLTGNQATTELGPVLVQPHGSVKDGGNIDVLIRPDDLVINHSGAAPDNATVKWSRFEGGSRLLAAELHDSQRELRIRVNHENSVKPGDLISLAIDSSDPLAVFAEGTE